MAQRERLGAFQELTKPGITRLVVLTSAAGFVMGTRTGVDLVGLLHAVIGVALVASGTNAFNQWWERDTDRYMQRTRGRPLPAGRLGPRDAALFAWLLSVTGVIYLAIAVNFLTAALALVTVTSYVLVYTPLKRRTTLNTLVGAIPGALPILGGWTAAGGEIDLGAITLFLVLFLWQMPHFLALAWMYRQDYLGAGFVMLSGADSDGRRTGRQAALYAAALLPVSIAPTLLGLTGPVYFVVAALLGAWLLAVGVRMMLQREASRAKQLFLVSIAYLPLLLSTMVFDKMLIP